MSIIKSNFIEGNAIGIFLYYYDHDLNIINKFQEYKKDKNISFLKLFVQYLNEYKVARNFIKNQTSRLLDLTMVWTLRNNPDDVYAFSEYLKENNITHGKKAISLSSKILMLNNPTVIFPIDALVKKYFKTYNIISFKDNYYKSYLLLVGECEKKHASEIEEHLNRIRIYTDIIEKKYSIINIEQVRKNRFLDKILWVSGKYTRS